jgi:hypothetical protein
MLIADKDMLRWSWHAWGRGLQIEAVVVEWEGVKMEASI